jgi:hypothetical protein
VSSQEEAQRAAVAQRQLDKGRQNFEEVYGSTTPESFDVTQDMAAMSSVGMEYKEHADPTLSSLPEPTPLPPGTIQQPQMPPQQPQPPVQPNYQEDTQQPPEVAPEASSENPGLELTDDPRENCRKLSESIGKIVPNPPAPETLFAWKRAHGNIFLLNIDDRIFIYRYLKRQEWMQINAKPQFANMTELQIEDMIFNKCVLWPGMDIAQSAALPANTVGMIVQQIRIQSHFLDPAYVATLTIKI